MNEKTKHSKILILFLATRPKFLTASAAPILVGTALGYAAGGIFHPLLFVLAFFSMMLLHSGANMANDYYDHTSRNDWVNQNLTPFSGGRRYIQEGILSAKATLLESLFLLALGAAVGLVIFLLTNSWLILVFGVIGLLGGFFYTGAPVRLGYRGVGEFVIMMLFGLLPVTGSYYLQTGTIDVVAVIPAVIVGILIFLVIFINEFPDAEADRAVNKRTLVVCIGVERSIWIYRIALVASYVAAVVGMLVYGELFWGYLFYLFTLPLAVLAIRFANQKDLTTPGVFKVNGLTVVLHALGSLALVTGFLISALV
ncbi:MAG: 1,4-dihydroxy-2-naphthoate octaprenyltransferase [Planctomycetota bacterium]|jgi:1,4-dihydroxy-2-naphthoate octaprenyltransferase